MEHGPRRKITRRASGFVVRTRLGVLISGNGSTLQALLDTPGPFQVVVVISSSRSAYGLVRARRAGIPVEILPLELKGSGHRAEAEQWILSCLEKYRVNGVFLAGFMRIISSSFIEQVGEKWKASILNIHPSLLPKYKGLNAFEEALKQGDREAGVTIHEVHAEVDSGQVVTQRKFAIPSHRDLALSSLWLHIHEQRLIRETVGKQSWRK